MIYNQAPANPEEEPKTAQPTEGTPAEPQSPEAAQ